MVDSWQLDEMWRRAEDLLLAGRVRSLGVANFSMLQVAGHPIGIHWGCIPVWGRGPFNASTRHGQT